MSATPAILVIIVSYETEELAVAHAKACVSDRRHDAVDVVLADNSVRPSAACRALANNAGTRFRYMHFADNPLYVGAARRVTEMLAAQSHEPLHYRAVVLCNADTNVDLHELYDAVSAAHRHSGDWRWILAPRIIEDHRRYEANPQLMQRPAATNRRAVMRWFPSWAFYRWLYRARRRMSTNSHAGAAPFTPIYSGYGAFLVFGSGFFQAGGTFHQGPLFGEERGFAEQARLLDVPTLYAPMLIVRHQAEASTSAKVVGARQRFEWQQGADRFYSSWDAASVLGSMDAAFAADDA